MTMTNAMVFEAAAALTANLFGRKDSNGKLAVANDPTDPFNLGIIASDYASGDKNAECVVTGKYKVFVGAGGLAPFVPVTTDANGKAVQAQAGDVVLGFHWQDQFDMDDARITAPADSLTDIVLLETRASLPSPAGLAVGIWDFSVEGSPDAADKALRDIYGGDLSIPAGAIVTGVRYFVQTVPLPNDATTIGLYLGSSGAPDPTLLTAIAINDGTTPFGAGGHVGTIDLADATDMTASASGGDVVIKSSGALTAGKILVFVDYINPPS